EGRRRAEERRRITAGTQDGRREPLSSTSPRRARSRGFARRAACARGRARSRTFPSRRIPMSRRIRALAFPIAALVFLPLCGCERRGGAAEVVLYCAFDQEHAEPLLADFEKQSGIHVKPNFDNEVTKTVGLTAQLINEKSRPRADVFWN